MNLLRMLGLLPVVLLLGAAPTASASVTIGQLAPGNPPAAMCNLGPGDGLVLSVDSGTSYVVPSTGGIVAWTITSWSHNAAAGTGQELKMKVFRQVSGLKYMAVAHDGPRDLTGGVINTFTTSLQVKSGDVLGLNDQNATTVNNACIFLGSGADLTGAGDLDDGSSNTFSPNTTARQNVTAELDPTATFTLGGLTRNKKNGTAQQAVIAPNPGNLTVSGDGVKQAGGPRAETSVTVSGPGTIQVPIRAKGKKKKQLNSTGKVKLNATITFTPTGGSPSSQTLKVKLKKKL